MKKQWFKKSNAHMYGEGWLNECDDTPFQEGFREDFKKRFRGTDKDGNPERMGVSIVKFLPRLFKAFIDAIKKLVSIVLEKFKKKTSKLSDEDLKKVTVKLDFDFEADVDFVEKITSIIEDCINGKMSYMSAPEVELDVDLMTNTMMDGLQFNKLVNRMIDVDKKYENWLKNPDCFKNADFPDGLVEALRLEVARLPKYQSMLITSLDNLNIEHSLDRFNESFDFEVGDEDSVTLEYDYDTSVDGWLILR